MLFARADEAERALGGRLQSRPYDESGHVLERADMRGNDMSYLCEEEPRCP
jgi:hypothetical protein